MLGLTLLCDGAFHSSTGKMECSFAVYLGSINEGLLLVHISRAQIPQIEERKVSSTEAEYAAVMSGLTWIRAKGYARGRKITVMSDSKAVVLKVNRCFSSNITALHYPSKMMKQSIIGH